MVSRNKQPMMTRRRSDQMKKGRPKRNVSPKNLDDSVSGLSWREERELKKALYASLQESRRQSRDDDEEGETNGDTPGSDRRSCQSSSTATPSYQDESSCSQDFTKTFSNKKDKDDKEVKKTKYYAQRKFAVNSYATLRSESLRSERRCSDTSLLSTQKKIHAQRKFAMGCSTPSTPSETPAKPKLKVSPVKLFPVRPKTEDFLTYLCFRGTSLLPPHLDLMNVHKDDYDLDSSVTNGNSRSGFTRDSSPASSSSTSHNNEDSCDVPDIAMRSQTPIKKAARASASTPETARGFVNLRNGRKVSPSKLSPLTASHRKRLEMKKKSPMKNDRLTLKRKAMATLTAAKRSSPQKKGQGDRKLKTSASDGELVKKKKKPKLKNLKELHVRGEYIVNLATTRNVTFQKKLILDWNNNTELLAVDKNDYNSKEDSLLDYSNFNQDNTYSHTSALDPATGLLTSVEDSGIQVSFHDNTAFHDHDVSFQDNKEFDEHDHLQSKEQNEAIKTFNLQTRDPNANEKSTEQILSLLNPLPSDLDESIDVACEMDISLNESLNVCEILQSNVTATSLLPVRDCYHSDMIEAQYKQKSEWARETNYLFKPAFSGSPTISGNITPTSRQTVYDPYIRNGKLGISPDADEIGKLDHNYSKVKKNIKFTVGSNVDMGNTSPGSKLVCSTPLKTTYKPSLLRRTINTFEISAEDHDMRRSLSPSKGGYSRDRSPNKSDQSRKRKSTSDLQDKQCSPSKSKRLNQKTNKPTEARSKSKLLRKDHSAKHSDSLETHPRKRHSTVVKVKRTFKPHRPMTRASTHFKSVLKAAKMVASKKLRLVKKLGDSVSQARNKHREKPSTSKYVEFKKRPEGGEKKKLSLESATSNTSIGSDSSGEIRIKTEQFPGPGDPPAVVQCPTYYPSEEQFRDPILYIQSIQDEAEPYGMCKIVPPCSWKMESRELEDFRFPTHTQYIHKLQHKWSAITEQLEYIKKLNVTHVNDDFHVPQIGGVELDLVKLYELVQKYGGMKGTVGKEKKWVKIADAMKVPKQADRVSKLYAAYCKYLLAYETHTDEETDKLVDTVRREKARQEHDNVIPTCYKCVYKGKSQPLSSFNRAARNTQVLYGQEDGNNFEDTEADYWNIVKTSDDHVSIQGASLDTSIYGSMFPVRRDNPYARHGWNLHNFVESKGSILHHLGLIAGVTVPTLHIGMLYTTKCLSCNGHNLPTVQYLHQGPGLVWYAVPQQETEHLKSAIKHSIPSHVRDKGFCVQQDSVMVPPATLVKHGVSMSRCVQTSKEFVVVFPSVNYCNISMGYNLSETVHYGTQEWISYGCQAAKDLSVNYDVELFSMDALLVFMARDNYTPETNLSILLPYLEKVVEREIIERKKLVEIGLRDSERLQDKLEKPTQKTEVLEEIIICDVSNKICYLSMVLNSHENSAFSLEQGLVHLQKKKNLKHCKLMYRYSEDELKALLKDVKYRIKNSNSSSPAGGSPKRKMLRKTDTKTSPVK